MAALGPPRAKLTHDTGQSFGPIGRPKWLTAERQTEDYQFFGRISWHE